MIVSSAVTGGSSKLQVTGGDTPTSFLKQQGSAASVDRYRHLLQVCTRRKSLAEAKELYASIEADGFESDSLLGNHAVCMFAKCGSLYDALQVFNNLREPNVFSWMALISACTKTGQAREAVRIFWRMEENGVKPDRFVLASVLKACASLLDLDEGKRIHAEAVRWRCEDDLFVGTSLVDMYAKCGSMADAQRVFNSLPHRNVVSWNAIIAGYAQWNQGEKAWELAARMEQEGGVRPDNWTFVSLLKACCSLAEKEEDVIVDGQALKLEALRKGGQIHAQVISRGYESDVFVCNTLLHMYAKCGDMARARHVFDSLIQRDVVSWNAMLAVYVQQEQGGEAFQLYSKMQSEGTRPDSWTFVCLLKASAMLADVEPDTLADGQAIKLESLRRGRAIHAEIVRMGCDSNVFVGNTLVHMYAKCGSMVGARNVFDSLAQRDVVSWTAVIAGYAKQGHGAKALEVYAEMQQESVRPNNRTFVSVLQACGNLAESEEETQIDGLRLKLVSLQKLRMIHAEAVRQCCDSDVFVGTALIDSYAKCGSMVDARYVFQALPQRDMVSWTALILGYAEQEQGDKALQLYAEMHKEGVTMDATTFLCILKACSSLGALDMCIQIHHDISRKGLLCSLMLGNALLDAYAKCGSMTEAQRLFDKLPVQDLVSWNALIAGYARQGDCSASLTHFHMMRTERVEPDGVTFVALLTACSNSGMVDEGLHYFQSMSRDHGITPTIQHYSLVLDLLGRAGLFIEVKKLLKTFPVEPDLPLWLSLLASCRNHNNVELGRYAFEQAIQMDRKHQAAYLLMSNIYASAQLSEDAAEISARQRRAGAYKQQPGHSWIEHDTNVHVFAATDTDHEQCGAVYATVERLGHAMKQT